MRGRKPTPTHLKVITRTDRADRRNEHEPQVEVSIPDAPGHLSPEARMEWDRVVGVLYAVGCLSDLDRGALGAYCQAYGRWVQAEELLAQMAARDPKGRALMITTKNGNMIQNPVVGAANKAAADMVRYAAEFGMTPSARSRVKADDAIKPSGAARYFA